VARLAALKAGVARRRWAPVILTDQVDFSKLSNDSSGIISRTVVYDNNFVRLTCLCQHAFYCLVEKARLIESSNNDRNRRGVSRKADSPRRIVLPICLHELSLLPKILVAEYFSALRQCAINNFRRRFYARRSAQQIVWTMTRK
jgi:hypothetical protein